MLKTLIIRACAVGDFVLNLPALQALQNVRADARFTLVGYPPTLELAREFISVDGIFSIESAPWQRLFYEPIPDLKFDNAIVWMKEPVVAEYLRRSGINDVVRADSFPAFGHAADHLLRTLRLPRPSLPDLWAPASNDIVIGAGSGSAKKNWPYFEELRIRIGDAVPLPQNLTLSELSHYLRHCRAYVGNDSGISHLAAFLGCPTISLFGPTDPRMWGPLGRRSQILWKRKLEDISVDEVVHSLTKHERLRMQARQGAAIKDMERTPEPELMDEQEQAAAYAAADWSESHGKIPGYFRDRFGELKSGRLVDLGCGAADVTIRFVKAFPGMSAVGIDGSDAMLAFGRRHVREAGLESRIILERHYLPDTSLETRSFDAAISNSLLHHMADPLTLWRAASGSVKPGAPIMVIDLLRPADHETAVKLVAEHAADAPPILQRDFIASLHAAYTVDEVRQQLRAAGLAQFQVDKADEFHFVAWGFRGRE